MPIKPPPRPTDSELDILRVLWDRGDATVREIHAVVSATSGTVLTTTLKTIQIMTGKRLLQRVGNGRPARFRAAVGQETTQRAFLSQILEKLYAGSTRRLVLSALDLPGVDPQEVAELRRLLDAAETPPGEPQ